MKYVAVVFVKCPSCKEDNVIKFVTNATGKQRYKCKNFDCDKNTFLLNYSRNGDLPEIKQKIIDMAYIPQQISHNLQLI